MVDPIPPVSVLRAFEAAVRFKSFSKAADSLGVSQSAISHSIKDLEIIVSKKLFTRTPRHTLPTMDALILRDAIRNGFKTIHKAVAHCQATGDKNEIVISCFPGFAVKWLFPRLIDFDTSHPTIAVSLRTLRSVGLRSVREIGEDEGDLALHYGSRAYENFCVQPLLEEQLIPVCSPEYLANSPPLGSREELAEHTLLCDEVVSDDDIQSLWGYWLEQLGFPGLPSAKRRTYGQSHMVIQAALEGRGIALGRTSLVVDDLRDKKLVVPFGPAIPSPFRYSVVTFDQDQKSEPVAAFNAWIKKEADKSVREFARMLNSIKIKPLVNRPGLPATQFPERSGASPD